MIAELTVSRSELEPAFALLRKLCKPRSSEQAVLSFDGACLHIELGGMAVAPAAIGQWSGQARVTGKFVLALAKVLPEGDPVKFSVDGDRLRVGTSVAKCAWKVGWNRTISLPEQPSHLQVLSLPVQHELFEIEASGYSGMLSESQAWREEKISDALKMLRDLGVTREDIEAVVDQAIARIHSK
jgi:hypothetical protein